MGIFAGGLVDHLLYPVWGFGVWGNRSSINDVDVDGGTRAIKVEISEVTGLVEVGKLDENGVVDELAFDD